MPGNKISVKKRFDFARSLVPPPCFFDIRFLYVFHMTTKEPISVHRMAGPSHLRKITDVEQTLAIIADPEEPVGC